MPTVNEISPAQAEMLMNEKDILLLDSRDLESYKQGHIEGAMMAHEALIDSVLSKNDKRTPVLVYCYQGASSKDTAKVFANSGFNEVYSIVGGYAEWKRGHAS